jgi:ketosteroid isomerase-like protein
MSRNRTVHARRVGAPLKGTALAQGERSVENIYMHRHTTKLSPRHCAVAAAFIVLTCASAAEAADHKPTPAEEQAVRAVLEKNLAARNRSDFDTIDTLFASDADNRTAFGGTVSKRVIRDEESRRKGREFVQARKQQGKQSFDSVRFITADVALVDVTTHWTGDGPGLPMTTMTTYVLRKESDTWKIVAGRVALPAKPPVMPEVDRK